MSADLVFSRPRYAGGPVNLVFGAGPAPTPSGVSLKYWDGTAFVAAPLMRWDGSAWVNPPASDFKRWSGSAWVQANP